MFGFLRKIEKGSSFRLDRDQEARLRKMEADIARIKKLLYAEVKRRGDEDDGSPES